jgi:hypothetical protein
MAAVVDFYRSLWGPFTGDAAALPAICAETVRRGYVGVETNPLMFGDGVDKARKVIEDHGLKFLSRAHTFGRDVNAHLDFVRRTVDLSHAFGTPHVIVQSGADFFSEREVDEYFNATTEIEAASGLRIAHESHRGCILFHPWAASAVLDRFPGTWLASDYSHWVIVAERFLDWEADILERCAARTLHIDARVGDAESPQVRDPRTEADAIALEKFVGYWDEIHAAAVERGDGLTVVPEFGPPPYEPPGAGDRDDICQWMVEHLRDRWSK